MSEQDPAVPAETNAHVDAATARQRYFLIVLVNMALVAGAVLGLLIIGRAHDWLPRILGAALILMALYCMAVIPKALARRWRTPTDA